MTNNPTYPSSSNDDEPDKPANDEGLTVFPPEDAWEHGVTNGTSNDEIDIDFDKIQE